jgi:hypothetical protein
MVDIGSVLSKISEMSGQFFGKIGGFIQTTNLPEQIEKVDYVGLFTNPWFMVPFVALIGYMLYKQAFRDLIIVTIVIALWWVSGTEYMQTLVVGDELQINKILPVLFGGAVTLGFIIYMFFGRS